MEERVLIYFSTRTSVAVEILEIGGIKIFSLPSRWNPSWLDRREENPLEVECVEPGLTRP